MAATSTGNCDEAQDAGDSDLGDIGFLRDTSIFSVISRLSDGTSLSAKEIFSRQCTEIDTLAAGAIANVRLETLLAEAIKGCKFCVTIGDPCLNDCPLIVVSDEFEIMTGYNKEEMVGRNCRILNKDCLLNQQDAFGLRQTCTTGEPFTGVLLNCKKSGQLFQNFVDLRGLTVASNPHTGQTRWFVVGIHADVTHVSEDEMPSNHFAALQSVVGTIRDNISNELSTLAVSGLHIVEHEQKRTDLPEMWWMLSEPTLVQALEDDISVSPNLSDIDRQTSEELTTAGLQWRQTSVVPDVADMSMPEVLRTQGMEVDACTLALLETSSITETIGKALLGCQYCVTISDPRLPNCPLLAVSDHFQTITGYSREEVIGKNVATLLSGGCKLRNLDKEQLKRASETGEPYAQVFVHRKKTGELFLDLMDLRGLNVAYNPRTHDNLWLLVCIQADVTPVCEENILAHQMKQLHEVAERIRSTLADRVAAMGVAGMLTHPSASKNHCSTNLWCPWHTVMWKQDSRQLNKNVASVRQVSIASSFGSNTEFASRSRQTACHDFARHQTTKERASDQDGDPATSSGVTEFIQQLQQQRNQHPPPLQGAEPTLSMRVGVLHWQCMPTFVLSMGLLTAMGYLLQNRRKTGAIY